MGRLPVPSCDRDEVLIRIQALAVNHVDTFVRSGAYATEPPMPFIIGRDLVGQVVAVGERVNDRRPGERVWCNSLGYDGRQGTFADYALAPAERVYPLPENQDPVEAVSVLHPTATAYLGLLREGRLTSGDMVFVGGAAGAVGSATVQLAVATGARVIASASVADTDWVQACGADTVFDYHAPAGIDLYWDNSGHHDPEHTLGLLAQGGRIIVAAGLHANVRLPLGALYTRDASLRGFAISNASVADLAGAAAQVNCLLARGELRMRIGRRLRLSDAAEAHRLPEAQGSDKVRGRIVVIPDD